MAKRIDPCRKSPLERLQDLEDGFREADGRGTGAKYLERVLLASDSLPNAVKFFGYAFLVGALPPTEDGEARALEALEAAERYLPVAREEMGAEVTRRLPELVFLERGVALRSDRAEYEEAIRLCDLALSLGYGKAFEARRRSFERLV
jgi:hypothetical protein